MGIGLLILPLSLLALLLAWASWRGCRRRWRNRRPSAAVASGLLASVLLLGALTLTLLSVGLWSFQRLATEEEVARLRVEQIGDQHYAVWLSDALDERRFELRGDQWQLDARLLRWKLPAALAGAPNLYRLDRLSGRYLDIGQEREGQRTAHDLTEGRLDLWTLQRRYPRWLPFLDADYGSGVYLPLTDGAQYRVSLGVQGGLIARPLHAEPADGAQ